MESIIRQKLEEDKKMNQLLKQNSYWIKDINRNTENYKNFVNAMKEKYHLKVTDRISSAIDKIDIINGILETLK